MVRTTNSKKKGLKRTTKSIKRPSMLGNQNGIGNNGGRPRFNLDYQVIKKLCRLQCTGEEIASFLDISYTALEHNIKTDFGISLKDFIYINRQAGRVSLRRAQWLSAMQGNPTMLIWMGKQYLDQKEPNTRLELTGAEGGPIEHEFSDDTIKAAFSALYRK